MQWDGDVACGRTLSQALGDGLGELSVRRAGLTPFPARPLPLGSLWRALFLPLLCACLPPSESHTVALGGWHLGASLVHS